MASSISSCRRQRSHPSHGAHLLPSLIMLLLAITSILNPNSSVVVVVAAQNYDTIDGHPCFRNLKGITDSMFDLAADHPTLASYADIGDSYLKANDESADDYDLDGGFDIYALKITASDGPTPSSKKGKVLIISGVHARELAPPELTMRFAETLLEGYGKGVADIWWLLRETEIHLIFHVNPDGRYVTENYKSTYWRKNLNDREGSCSSTGFGVDINRNFDFMWGDKDGSSSNPCSSTYHGKSPHSEPETKAVVEYARDLFPEEQRRTDPEGDRNEPWGDEIMGVFVDVHAPGGYIFYPWGFEDSTSPDDDALQALGRKLSYFNGYKLWAGGQPDWQYPAAGDSSDYMYGALGVASFGLELGKAFYEDCDNFERAVLPDNIAALLYASTTAKKPFSIIKGPDILGLNIAAVSDANDGSIRVTVVASDSLLVNTIRNFDDHVTGDQGVDKVKIYLDVHPDNFGEGDLTWDMQLKEVGSEEYTFDGEILIPSAGEHILYAQAVDGDGYAGPVSSAFFLVEKVETAPPSADPTLSPSTSAPTDQPTSVPSKAPSRSPTAKPTSSPTRRPTSVPSKSPSRSPTAKPSASPIRSPTTSPSQGPSKSPVTDEPSVSPNNGPTNAPTSLAPTITPSVPPTAKPSKSPTLSPSVSPTASPTSEPSSKPTSDPTINLSTTQSDLPSVGPSNLATASNQTLQLTDSLAPQATVSTPQAPESSLTSSSNHEMPTNVTAITPTAPFNQPIDMPIPIEPPVLSSTVTQDAMNDDIAATLPSPPNYASTSVISLGVLVTSVFLAMCIS